MRGAPADYLKGAARAAFDRWLAEAAARFEPELRFPEIRKGVQALSCLYVERRAGSDLSARASQGAAKRAALATYFAPLHFLATRYALAALLESEPSALAGVRRVVDLGCGTGAAGAAAATVCAPPAEVAGVDRSGWALGEARRTYASFGLRARTVRSRLPQGLPRPGPGDLVVLGWCLNELGERERDLLLGKLAEARALGARTLVLEPLAGPVAPWWEEARERLGGASAWAAEVKRAIERPARIAELDRASGLDHRVIGMRALFAQGCVRSPGFRSSRVRSPSG